MNQYRIKLQKHFEITVEVSAENALLAQQQALEQNPGYTAHGIRWLNAPPEEPKVRKPRKPRTQPLK